MLDLDLNDITELNHKDFLYKGKNILQGYGKFVKYGYKNGTDNSTALFANVVVEGKRFREHAWITIQINEKAYPFRKNKTYEFQCRLMGYLNIDNPTGPLKYSLKRICNIQPRRRKK
jgi:hypothetical protein